MNHTVVQAIGLVLSKGKFCIILPGETKLSLLLRCRTGLAEPGSLLTL